MELIIILILLGFMFVSLSGKPRQSKGMPTAYRSNNGIEGHYDFLEMNGFVTSEENKLRREFARELKEHPERFTKISLKDFYSDKNKPKTEAAGD
jgi:hypothetical protein